LSLADEPLLDGALDDRHAWVRKAASDLLAALPGSALGRRMADRARECLWLDPGVVEARLLVRPPGECGAAMRRDGITPDAGVTGAASRGRVLLELIARTPLRTWTDGFGMRPACILALPAGGWESLLFSAWSRAAVTQSRQDQGEPDRQAQAWIAALIRQVLAEGAPWMRGDDGIVGKLARQADPALGAPGALPATGPEAPPLAGEAVRVLRFRYEMHEELKDDDGTG
jgi:hypothetical protein